MKKYIGEYERKVAIAQEEFLKYGVIHPKTLYELYAVSTRCSGSWRNIKSLPQIEKQRIGKANKRCMRLTIGTEQILDLAYTNKFWPISEVDDKSLIPWLESAVDYVDEKFKNLLKAGGFHSLKEAVSQIKEGKVEDTEENVSYYAALSQIKTKRDGYRALFKVTKERQRELEELVKDC